MPDPDYYVRLCVNSLLKKRNYFFLIFVGRLLVTAVGYSSTSSPGAVYFPTLAFSESGNVPVQWLHPLRSSSFMPTGRCHCVRSPARKSIERRGRRKENEERRMSAES